MNNRLIAETIKIRKAARTINLVNVPINVKESGLLEQFREIEQFKAMISK